MVKDLKKEQILQTNIINNVSKENITSPKSRQQIYSENYQKNKEKKKQQRRDRYAQEKKQEQLANKKHYQASSIKVLLTLKEYTELNREKQKLWLDFCWTIQDCQKNGFFDIVQIQQLEQLAGNLVRDYYQTAQAKAKIKGNWNSLSEEKQAKLIKYWGQEKARKEQELNEALVKQEKAGELWEKELEIAKFHEERGKINCECWQCEEQKVRAKEVKEQILNDNEEKPKEQCSECKKWVAELDEENGICKSCKKKYE